MAFSRKKWRVPFLAFSVSQFVVREVRKLCYAKPGVIVTNENVAKISRSIRDFFAFVFTSSCQIDR